MVYITGYLGGRVSLRKLNVNEISAGASNDIQSKLRRLRLMVRFLLY